MVQYLPVVQLLPLVPAFLWVQGTLLFLKDPWVPGYHLVLFFLELQVLHGVLVHQICQVDPGVYVQDLVINGALTLSQFPQRQSF